MGDNDEDVKFVRAVGKLRKAQDSEIEHEMLRGRGIRFTGFRKIRCSLFTQVLKTYGKRAKFHMNMDSVVVDCYPDTDPTLMEADGVQSLPNFKVFESTKVQMTCGSILSREYTVGSINTDGVCKLLMSNNVLDVVLKPKRLQILSANSQSVGIVNGLHDQITQRKVKFSNAFTISRCTRLTRGDVCGKFAPQARK